MNGKCEKMSKESRFHRQILRLMEQMTFAEKLGQMTQVGTSIYGPDLKLNANVAAEIRAGRMGSFLSVTGVEMMNEMQRIAVEESRLGIPLFFAHDIIHGYRILFPAPAAEACSFEPELAAESCRHIGAEARANGIHLTFAPMVDVSRDPRWGRGFEGSGEDVLLQGEFAKARIRGFQQEDLKKDTAITACAKHFAGYGAVQGGRDYNSVDLSDNALYNDYLPPFRAAVDSGVEFVMTAFHDLNGVPCTANQKLLREILRRELGFEGIIISDANSLRELQAHGFAADTPETAQKGLDAGLDVEMSGMGETQYLDGAARTPENEEKVNRAVYRILDFKFRLGLFEKPYTDPDLAAARTALPETVEAARNAARRSIVLLENRGALPLRGGKIAVIGALAADRKFAGGGWVDAEAEAAYETCVTVLEGIQNCPAFDAVTYAPAYSYITTNEELTAKAQNGDFEFFETDDAMLAEALAAADRADAVLLVAGEHPVLSGEAKSRMNLELPGPVKRVLEGLQTLRKPVILLVMAGRPLLLGEVSDKVDGLLFSYALGSQAGSAVAEVLTGAYNPSGKLAVTVPSANGQSPAMHYAHNATGKPYHLRSTHTTKYIDGPNEPAYCFGYGKSYTEFAFGTPETDKKTYRFGETVRLHVPVSNRGKVDGEEVVQVYMRDPVASIVRPVKQLIAFRKVAIPAGTEAQVEFELDTAKMGFWMDRKYVLEPGKILLYAGGDSNAAGMTEVELKKEGLC